MAQPAGAGADDAPAPLSYAEKAKRIARQMVSLEKKRYQKDGFDLDLTYITPRVIAMGWPTEEGKLEAAYRNPMPEVQRFFSVHHQGHYKIYNLCWERAYDLHRYFERVSARILFFDHNCPPLQLLVDFMRGRWLLEHSRLGS